MTRSIGAANLSVLDTIPRTVHFVMLMNDNNKHEDAHRLIRSCVATVFELFSLHLDASAAEEAPAESETARSPLPEHAASSDNAGKFCPNQYNISFMNRLR